MYGWLWEKDAGARPEPIRSTYLKEVEACDLYIGLFWLGYGPITIKFSELVGDVLREIPPDREPLPQFKFYI